MLQLSTPPDPSEHLRDNNKQQMYCKYINDNQNIMAHVPVVLPLFSTYFNNVIILHLGLKSC